MADARFSRCALLGLLASFFFLHGSARESLPRQEQAQEEEEQKASVPKKGKRNERETATTFFFFFASLSSRDNVLKKRVEIFSLFFRPPPPLSLLSSSIFYALRALAECSFSFFRFSSLFVNSTRFVNGSSSCSKKKQVAGRVAFERRAVEQGKAASFLASSSRWGRSPPPPPQL